MRRTKLILWADSLAAAIAGAAVLMLHESLTQLYSLPGRVITLIGLVNVLYASYSFALATARHRHPATILVLVSGNLVWALVCLVLIGVFWTSASPAGVGLLAAEASFVALLAGSEWRFRDELGLQRAKQCLREQC